MFAGTNAGIPARSLLERARNIILGPGTEWLVAAAEQTSPAALFSGYVVPLALIGPVCMVLGQLFFGHHPLPIVLPLALVSFALELAAVFVAASIANALAPSFTILQRRILIDVSFGDQILTTITFGLGRHL